VNKLKLAIVSCGFLGLSPIIPGTAGTLGGVALAWGLAFTGSRFPLFIAIAAVALYAVGRSLGEWAERYAAGKDPGFFVLDEVIGYLVTVFWLRGPSVLALTLAFFLFRFFDIVKPPPARQLEALGGGDGILLDDVFSGLYGLGVMALARVLLPDLPWTV
jgi:phosphatidylglycerophosphatase A